VLTDAQCKNAKCPPHKSRDRLSDGGNLYLEVAPNGSKRWFWKYRHAGSERRLAIGSYPDVGCRDARLARDAAKLQLAGGHDPVLLRKAERLKATTATGSSVKEVALEWYAKMLPTWADGHAFRTKRQLERDLFPWLADFDVAKVTAPQLLGVLTKIVDRGAIETAHRVRGVAVEVWAFAISTERAERNIAVDLKRALPAAPPARHRGAITNPAEFGGFLRASRAYKGQAAVRAALQLAPILFQRPGELRVAKWDEIDLEAATWTVPAARMKGRKEAKLNGDDHILPLPRQAVAILRDLHVVTGGKGYVFPSPRVRDRPISDNAVRAALMAMGFTGDVQTWHGFRASARTMLAEQLNVDEKFIEAQLAHQVKDANGRAYNRTKFLEQRGMMLQRWADYLDRLASGGEVVKLRAA
jgi:integrase